MTLLAAGLTALSLIASSANASTTQVAMFQPGTNLITDPAGTLIELHSLGVGVVRVIVPWASVAPQPSSTTRPSNFDANDPASYPASNWTTYDAIVRDASALGIRVDLTLSSGAPLWADTGRIPAAARTPLYAWQPSPTQYQAFVHAVGVRYGGRYVPAGQTTSLPRVDLWGLWNEPNFGKNLAPQASSGSSVLTAAAVYRTLVDAGWKGLGSSGHAHDQVLIGHLAARGSSAAADAEGSRRTSRHLRHDEATAVHPRAVLHRFAIQHAAREGGHGDRVSEPRRRLPFRAPRFVRRRRFRRSSVSAEPSAEPRQLERPGLHRVRQLPRLAATLDRVQRLYGSHRKLPIYVTEYGYITNPPNHSLPFVSPATAAKYINWAEYLSYKNPRIATTMQFLLEDPNPRVGVPEFGGFASGLEFFGGKHKPSYDAYRLPLFLPLTSVQRSHALEVWGCVRPAHYAQLATHRTQSVEIQFQPESRGAFTTHPTVPITNPRGYFDVTSPFPTSGSVRLQWSGTRHVPQPRRAASPCADVGAAPAPTALAVALLAAGHLGVDLRARDRVPRAGGDVSGHGRHPGRSGRDGSATLRALGVGRVRLFVAGGTTPLALSYRRPQFNADDPKAYGDWDWSRLDAAVSSRRADGINLDLDLGGGAPLWATRPDRPTDGPHPSWAPNASDFGAFVRAVGTRYSGNYDPDTEQLSPGDPADLPAVHFWSIWNEPNYGPSLAPQGDPRQAGHSSVERSAWLYRNLLDAAWSGAARDRPRRGHDPHRRGRAARRGREQARAVQRHDADAVPSRALLRRHPLPRAARTRRGASRLPDERRRVPLLPRAPPGPVSRQRICRPPLFPLVPAERRAQTRTRTTRHSRRSAT